MGKGKEEKGKERAGRGGEAEGDRRQKNKEEKEKKLINIKKRKTKHVFQSHPASLLS